MEVTMVKEVPQSIDMAVEKEVATVEKAPTLTANTDPDTRCACQ